MAVKRDENSFRRQFPRKDYKKGIGFLYNGEYIVLDGCEMGEGGLSFFSPRLFPLGEEGVLSFQIPGGSFISVRVEVRHTSAVDKNERFVVGCLFKNLKFDHKREIRAYVSSQLERVSHLKSLN